MALEPLLRFADLKKLGIAHSYTQINRMVASVGFPPGRLLSRQCRVWTESELRKWLDSRPSDRVDPDYFSERYRKRKRA
jgi:predicted DNA-binding transcriptional regulator AlpA